MLHTVRRRAAQELRRYGPGIVLGTITAQLAVTLTHNHAVPVWIIVFLGCTGDNIGFYGYEWARESFRIRHIHRGFWRTVTGALWNTIKHYWLAELLDTLAFRSWMLALTATFISNQGYATFTGNVLADVLFFGVVILTGVELSDWAIGRLRNLRRTAPPPPLEPAYDEELSRVG